MPVQALVDPWFRMVRLAQDLVVSVLDSSTSAMSYLRDLGSYSGRRPRRGSSATLPSRIRVSCSIFIEEPYLDVSLRRDQPCSVGRNITSFHVSRRSSRPFVT